MSLIVGQYYRGDPKQKPKQWGPASAVASNLADVLNNIGIDHEKMLLACPFWAPGAQYNYANHLFGIYNGATFYNNLLAINSTGYVSLYSRPKTLSEYTIFLKHSDITFTNWGAVFTHYDTTPLFGMQRYSGSNYIRVQHMSNSVMCLTNGAMWQGLTSSGHSCLSWDGTTPRYYKNGKLAETLTNITTQPEIRSNVSVHLGRDYASQSSTYRIDTEIDQMLIFSSLLDDDKIRLLYDNQYILWQRPIFRTYFDLGANTGLSVQTGCSWKIFDKIPINTSWKLFDFNDQSVAWKIKNELSTGSKWKIVKSGASDISWKLLADTNQASAWKILTSKDHQASWKILKRMASGSSWAVINRMSWDAAWRILNQAVLDQDISWKVLGCVSKPAAWSLIAKQDQSSAWKIFDVKDISTDWRILTSGAIHQDLAWGIKNSGDKIVGWKVQAAESANAAWKILNEDSHDFSWDVLQITDADLAFKIFTELEQDASWVVGEAGADIPDAVYEFFPKKRNFIFSQKKRTLIFYQQER